MCATPKAPKPAPVIERQAYKMAPSRESLSSGAPSQPRRQAGVETSAQGVPGPASTTRRVLAGGDQQILPLIGGGGASLPGTPSPTPSTPSPMPTLTTGGGGLGARNRNAVFGAPKLRVGRYQQVA